MEFAKGCASLAVARRELEDFAIVEVDEAIAWEASRIARLLKGASQHKRGQPAGVTRGCSLCEGFRLRIGEIFPGMWLQNCAAGCHE